MAEPNPTFPGEVQFRRYSDTSTQGTQIVLALPDREALQSFIGLEGKRFMAVLVQIGDDEQPVAGNPVTTDIGNPTSGKPREPLGDLCWRTVNWCKEPEFQEWVASRLQCHPEAVGEEQAKQYILMKCGVTSRKHLDEVPWAGRKCREFIVGPYQKHLIARGIVR